MFGSRRRRTLDRALVAQNAALDAMADHVASLKVHNAINKRAGGLALDERDKTTISRIVASGMIARENIMLALGRKHTFDIRPLYPPIDPDDTEEFTHNVKRHLFSTPSKTTADD